jgi:hypothetical protein
LKVYLYSRVPLTPEQWAESQRDIGAQAKAGFRVEVQREVLAHGSEETYNFLVRRIEPANRFYGSVDGDTIFELIRDDKPPPPSAGKCELLQMPPISDPDALEKIRKITDELFSEVNNMKTFMDELEALRVKHGVSWTCLLRVVEAVDVFREETAPRL